MSVLIPNGFDQGISGQKLTERGLVVVTAPPAVGTRIQFDLALQDRDHARFERPLGASIPIRWHWTARRLNII